MKINEYELEDNLINSLKNLGYEYRNKDLILSQRKSYINNEESIQEFVIFSDLEEALIKINNNIDKATIKKIKNKIDDLKSTSNIFQRNKHAYNYLSNGITIEDENGDSKTYKLIDFDNVENNIFVVTNQFTTLNDSLEHRRPDVVIYCNGLPIIVWELKTPDSEIEIFNNDILEKAYNQITNYVNQITNLFTFNFFNVISNWHTTKFGSTFASFSRFMYWRKENQRKEPFYDFVESLFNKKVLLNLFKNFTIYIESKEEKIIASYHQYFGVKNALVSIKNAIENKTKKAGIIFHATGTGKTYTMVFLTRNFNLNFPKSTVLVISDRIDLDDQTHQTFVSSSSYLNQNEITKIKSIDDLVINLKEHLQDGIFFSTVQKFQEKIDKLSNRENILVITDEAHRSHNNIRLKSKVNEEGYINKSKPFALVLREAFPNATFIGFTGSPRDDKNASTEEVFGKIISVFPMSEAEKDGFIVPLHYERRHQKLRLTSNSDLSNLINQHYEEICENADEIGVDRKRLNKELQKIENILSNPKIIEEITKDFIHIYEKRKNNLKGKAIFVCYNRKIGFELYKKIIEIEPSYKKIIKLIATGNSQDNPEMAKVIGTKEDQKRWANEFKNEDSDFKIAIVIDMWLTGFDNPMLDTLFLFKPIKMHNLIQTIARINRVYTDKKDKTKYKKEGLIIDYVGIHKHLNDALTKYYNADQFNMSNTNKSGYIENSIDELKITALNEVEKIFLDYFKNVNSDFKTNKLDLNLASKMMGIILRKTNEEIKEFIKKTEIIKKKYSYLNHILNQEEDCKFSYLIWIHNAIINSQNEKLKEKLKDKIKVLLDLLKDSIYQEKIDFISKFNDGRKIELSELMKYMKADKNKDEDIESLKYTTLFKILFASIEDYKNINKSKSVNLIEKMNELLDKYNNGFITLKEFVESLSIIGEDLQQIKEEDEKSGINTLNENELLFFKLINVDSSDEHIKNKKLKDDAIKIAKEAFYKLQQEINDLNDPLWYKNGKFIKNLRVTLKDLMEKHEFPPEDCNYGAEYFVGEMINQYLKKDIM